MYLDCLSIIVGIDHCAQVLDGFRRAHDGSMADLYNFELSLTGLERMGGDDGDLLTMTRREQLEQYQSRWLKLEFASSDNILLDSADFYDIVGGMLAWKVSKQAGTVRFLQIASSARCVPRLEWKVKCPEHFLGLKIDPTSNILVTLTPVNK